MRGKTAIIFVALLGLAGPLLGAPKSPAVQGRGAGAKAKASVRTEQGTFDLEIERIIRDWFGLSHNLEGLPPGLAKRDQLPPGLQKQLVRNGTLPPGLQKRLHDVPHDLAIRLPKIPENRRLIILGSNVILLDETTSLILDILENVF